ncbi:hypothetical protein SEA_NOSLEEP_137 [Mycobacterium phage NoSleep]|nr:hypothetical protein SEA_NOSLEEP_137 [Mycobacterium phage NoSleep]
MSDYKPRRCSKDNGGHCVYVRWTDGSMAQGGGTDGWYSRHALMPTEAILLRD